MKRTDLVTQWGHELADSIKRLVSVDFQTGKDFVSFRKAQLTPIESTFKEPRIGYLKGVLENLLAENIFAFSGCPPKSFYLVNLEEFRTERISKIKWNLGALSSVCNLDCEFCYRYGSPRDKANGVKMMEGRKTLSTLEASKRIELARDGYGLFSATADLGDDFVNPEIISIYKLIRDSDPGYIIDTTTHGGFLTEDVVQSLSVLKPVDLCVSLNSANPEIRKEIMRDKSPMVAINSLSLLHKYKIWFSVSIVAWPTIPLDDIERTILFADRFQPRAIRVQLPGKTRFHPSKIAYERDVLWGKLVVFLRSLRAKVKSPIYWQPYLFGANPITPEITGTIPGSPAAQVGILPHDQVISIDGVVTGSRERARALLARGAVSKNKVNIVVMRKNKKIEFNIEETDSHRRCYPYGGDGYSTVDSSFGIFMNQGLHLPSIAKILNDAQEDNVKRLVAISSPLMVSAVKESISLMSKHYKRPPIVDLITPEARYFGGDIILGDLLTFEDCSEALEDYKRSKGAPDVVLLPESMTEAGKDLVGAAIDDLRRSTSLDVMLAQHPRILD